MSGINNISLAQTIDLSCELVSFSPGRPIQRWSSFGLRRPTLGTVTYSLRSTTQVRHKFGPSSARYAFICIPVVHMHTSRKGSRCLLANDTFFIVVMVVSTGAWVVNAENPSHYRLLLPSLRLNGIGCLDLLPSSCARQLQDLRVAATRGSYFIRKISYLLRQQQWGFLSSFPRRNATTGGLRVSTAHDELLRTVSRPLRHGDSDELCCGKPIMVWLLLVGDRGLGSAAIQRSPKNMCARLVMGNACVECTAAAVRLTMAGRRASWNATAVVFIGVGSALLLAARRRRKSIPCDWHSSCW